MAATTEPRFIGYTGIVPAMPEDEYHAHPALSSTRARTLLDSPARYKYELTHQRADTKAFDVGSAVHAMVLGIGSDIEELDFKDFRTNAAKEKRDAARAAGLIPLLKHEVKPIRDMAEAVLRHPTARALFEQPGTSEASVFATDPDTGIALRARFDFLPHEPPSGRRMAVDLKTSAKPASPQDFRKTIASFGYDVQQAHYGDTLALATGEDDADMAFVVIEKFPPYLIGVYQLSDPWINMGKEKSRRAREILAECIETDSWPGYGPDITFLDAPVWLQYEHEERYGDNTPFEDIQ